MPLTVIVLSIIFTLLLVLFLPIKGTGSFSYVPPSTRIHEADAVLSRRLLIPGTKEYNTYYSQHPERKEPDDRSRLAPGLLSEQARYFHPGTFAAAKAGFEIINILNSEISIRPETKNAQLNPAKVKIDPQKVSQFISVWLKQSGAHSVGFTSLKDYHLYSHKGRGHRSGDLIEKIHDNAIAITVEMDHRSMQSAPEGSSVMESADQYLRSGVLALKLAAYIRELGYESTAHIDGNYEVICPLVAADAGLGVLGRMGLLMTPRLGPRVRISVVTTSMPLIYSKSKPDNTTLHFCHHCKKCVYNCPASAIPEGPRVVTEGKERWQINSERCYQYWTISGTDCGRCITVCPYSHSDNMFHRFIRWAIKNNLVFRHLAIKLDDIIYSRKPPIRPLPGWTDILDAQ